MHMSNVSTLYRQSIKTYKLLHAYVHCVYIVLTKYQIASSKAVVGVDRPIKALSMHIQSHIRE